MIRYEPTRIRHATASPVPVPKPDPPIRPSVEPGASRRADDARVLILSIFFAPCAEVGGKRFSNLSRYLSDEVSELHVLSRLDRSAQQDRGAFRGNVHRTPMFPPFPPARRRGFGYKASRFWAKWVCQIDPYIGWVVPATLKGIALCRRHRLNVVIVTVPAFSSLIAGVLISKATGCRLIIDYRDEWTNLHDNIYRRPFGRYLSRKLERAAIRQASAVVVCTDVMQRDFLDAFASIAPLRVATIYSGYEEHRDEIEDDHFGNGLVNMVYAGKFYRRRRLSLIAPALASLREAGVISPESFRLHLWSRLDKTDHAVMARHGISDLVEVHDMVSYDEIRRILRSSDILFLPSGDDYDYAVPFKFFDYLSARRPILAVASKSSAVYELFGRIDCGICAEIDDTEDIARSLQALVRKKRIFTYAGAETLAWRNAADRYCDLLSRVARNAKTDARR